MGRISVISRVVIDEFAAEPPATRLVLGGSGFWAAYGAALGEHEVALASKVGPDFAPFAPSLVALGISREALREVNRPTSRTRIAYDGETRHETPVPSWDAQVAMRAQFDDLPPTWQNADAFYVFREAQPGFWSPLMDHISATGAMLAWEIPGAVCSQGLTSATRAILERCDVLSINRAEARDLVGDATPADTLAALMALGPTAVLLRLGAQGSMARSGAGAWEASASAANVADLTGAGNAATGAFISALLSGATLPDALAWSSAVAGTAIEQTGPRHERADARRRAAELASSVRLRHVPVPLATAPRQ